MLAGIFCALWNPLASYANAHVANVSVAAGSIYGVLRVANSLMSVVHDIDVEGSAVVASVTTSPGQALEPVIDTIDRTSDVLFVIMVVAGILALVFKPISVVGGIILFIGASLKLALLVFKPNENPTRLLTALSSKSIKIGVIFTIILPLAFTTSSLLGDLLTEQAYADATSVFNELNDVDGSNADLSLKPASENQADENSQATAPTTSEKSLLESIRKQVFSVYDGTTKAIDHTVESASEMAVSIPSILSKNTLAISAWVKIGFQLFQAAVSISVAYLLKLIVLPSIIMMTLFYFLRKNA